MNAEQDTDHSVIPGKTLYLEKGGLGLATALLKWVNSVYSSDDMMLRAELPLALVCE